MDKILAIAVEYRIIFLIVAIVLVFALIGALADRANSKRFTINTEKMKTNVTKETVKEENKTAGDAPEVEKTSVSSGSEFTAAPVSTNVQSQNSAVNIQVNAETASTGAEVGQTETL